MSSQSKILHIFHFFKTVISKIQDLEKLKCFKENFHFSRVYYKLNQAFLIQIHFVNTLI
jgi:hypothetical protein